MESTSSQGISYKTHILIGCTASGNITVNLSLAACTPARGVATEDRCGTFDLCDLPALHADFHYAGGEGCGIQTHATYAG